MSTIHSRIKEQRLKNGYTLVEVAEKIGVREATYQRYESGVIKNIKPKIIEKLAEIFNVSPAYLTGWTDGETEKNDTATDKDEIKTSTKLDLLILDIDGMINASKMMKYSVIGDKIDPEEISGMFGVFQNALKKVREELRDVERNIYAKGD